MMRPGDKLASFAALAGALSRPEAPAVTLDVIGDGAERAAVEALLAPLGPRVRFRGVEPDPRRLRAGMEAADAGVSVNGAPVTAEPRRPRLPLAARRPPFREETPFEGPRCRFWGAESAHHTQTILRFSGKFLTFIFSPTVTPGPAAISGPCPGPLRDGFFIQHSPHLTWPGSAPSAS